MRREKGEILAFDFAVRADCHACKDASRDECVEGDGQDKLRAHLSHLSQKFQTGLPFSISGQQSDVAPSYDIQREQDTLPGARARGCELRDRSRLRL